MSSSESVLEKYQRNRLAGENAYTAAALQSSSLTQQENKASPLKEFLQYEPDHINGISYRATFTPQSREELYRKIIQPLKKLAERSGIELYGADLWQPHITLCDVRFDQASVAADQIESQRTETFKRVAENSELQQLAQELVGTKIVMDFGWGGNAITLAAQNIPPAILALRTAASELTNDLDLGSKDFSNIAHTTIARMGKIQDSAQYDQFASGIAELWTSLQKEPLSLEIAQVTMLPNAEFQQKHEAFLFKIRKVRDALMGL